MLSDEALEAAAVAAENWPKNVLCASNWFIDPSFSEVWEGDVIDASVPPG